MSPRDALFRYLDAQLAAVDATAPAADDRRTFLALAVEHLSQGLMSPVLMSAIAEWKGVR